MDIGKVSESKAMYALIELGWTVAIPFSDSAKYDLISESNEGLKRIQVKTVSKPRTGKTNGTMPSMNMRTPPSKTGKKFKYKPADIDIFVGVYGDQILVFDEVGQKTSVSISKMKPLCEHPLFVKL